jgi:hypothetical protein
MKKIVLTPETKQKLTPGQMGVSGITGVFATLVVFTAEKFHFDLPADVAVAAVVATQFLIGKFRKA